MAKNKQQIKFEADVSGFKTNIKEAQSSIKTLNNELKLNQEQLKGNKENTDILSQRIETLKQKYEEQTKIVDNTRASYEKAVEVFGENSKEAENLKNKLLQSETAQQNIKNEIDKTNQKLTAQTDKLITTSKAWQESGERLKDYGSKIDKIGNKLSIVSGLIGGVAVASLKASVDFESAFAGVTKTVDGTEEQLAELRQGILDMSTELPSSATEIATVAESAGQLGIQTDSILDFTKVMIDLGNSTNVSADEASSALAKFANVTKMSADQYQNLGSTIVALGNNYATTEADIISMAQNLASAGTQVGMSQSDIMALATALSSVGLEAQAGGTAFSKALVEMQLAVETNSKDLKNWADVAGMSTKEFAKLFKEDATSALKAFIKGLSECGGETESAIKVLDDMGITETRMRDALLRSANASDTFTSAIELGSKAWKENTALTEEASKRYETTESQMEMLKNEAVKTAIEFGDELAPSLRQIVKDAKPMLNSISSAVKAFANLDDKTKKNIITVGAYLVALGPVIKIGGDVIKTIGGVKTGIGTLTGAIGVLKNGTEGASKGAVNLAKSLQTLVSPTGLVVASIGALAGAYTWLKNESEKIPEELQKTIDKMEETKNAHEEYRAELDKTASTSLAEIENTENLRNELTKLVDENGKVKEGYKDRVSVILNELNKALGTEYSLTGDIINQYQTLQEEIDLLILKKKAQIVLENEESKYATAIQNKTSAYQTMINAQNEYNKALEGKTYEQYFNDLQQQYIDAGYTVEKSAEHAREHMAKWVDGYKNTYESSVKIYNDYLTDIAKYENDYAIMQSDNTQKIKQMIDERINNYGRENLSREEQIKEGIQQEIYNINELEKLYQEDLNNQNEISAQANASAIQSSKQRLQTLLESLIAQTSIINENSPEVIETWKQLATNSYSVYYDQVSQLPEELSKKIQEMTGVTIERTPELVNETKNMADQVLAEFENNEEFRKTAITNLQSYLNGLEDEELKELLKEAGTDNVDEVIKGIREGNLSEDEGKKILSGLQTGLENTTWRDKLWSTARGIASTLSGLLTVKANVNGSTSNLPGHKDGLDYVPYDNYIARLHKGERVLTAEENKEYMTGNLENKVSSNRNIVVQFFPQSMSEQELQRAENYIAKKWGMAL